MLGARCLPGFEKRWGRLSKRLLPSEAGEATESRDRRLGRIIRLPRLPSIVLTWYIFLNQWSFLFLVNCELTTNFPFLLRY